MTPRWIGRLAGLLIGAAMLAMVVIPWQRARQDNELLPGEARAGFHRLFDGKTTAGWRRFRGSGTEGWAVVGGALQRVKGGADLVSEAEFTDFELRFEWKIPRGGNSGVLYRVTEEDDATWKTGPEYQILDDAGHPDGRDPKTSAASMYGLFPPLGKRLAPVGKWNTASIVVQGWQVEHWLNGVVVVHAELTPQAVASSKFAVYPHFAAGEKGRIALQDHGAAVAFRRIRIRPL